jgi:lactoylglutathione lyase
MRYLHTMIRVADLDASLKFYTDVLGLREVRRMKNDAGRFTLVFLSPPHDPLTGPENRQSPLLELTYNWDGETYTSGRNFGHLAYEVDDIYAFCQNVMERGIAINRPPRDGNMAFIKSPDGISIELLQKGAPLPPSEPWLSMPNEGKW